MSLRLDEVWTASLSLVMARCGAGWKKVVTERSWTVSVLT